MESKALWNAWVNERWNKIVQSFIYKYVHSKYHVNAGQKAYHKSNNEDQTADLQTRT